MAKQDIKDVIIIGGGISAHTAALYTARASLKPLVISGPELDQLSTTSLVENFPGFPEGIQGPELVQNAKAQAQRFGAEYVEMLVDRVTKEKNLFKITAEGKTYLSRTLIICTGASPKTLRIPGEKEYWGKGVSTCATCDAALYVDKTAAVVGGGDSAMEEALALTHFTKKVYLIHRRKEFRASKIMQDRVLSMKDKIEVVWNSTPLKVIGEKFVTGTIIKDVETGKERTLKIDGFFLAIGHTPNTQPFKDLVRLDEQGYIITDKLSNTSEQGVFAAGDCQDHVFRQAITSAGTGCQAALQAERHIEQLKATKRY